MKINFNYIPVFFVLILSACSTVVKFPVWHSPDLVPDDENKTVVILNDIDISKLNIQNQKEAEVRYSGIRNLIVGLTDSVSEDDDFKFLECDSLTVNKTKSIFPSDTIPEYKKFIYRKYSDSNLLIVKNFEIFFNQTDNFDDSELDENKVVSRNYYLGIRAGFELYGKNGQFIESSIVEDLMLHKTKPVLIKWITIDPSVKKAGTNVDLVSYSVGRKYRAKFYPAAIYVYRQYYMGKIFREADRFVKKGDWMNARKALLKIAESNDPKIPQEKLAHNLSVVNEALRKYQE